MAEVELTQQPVRAKAPSLWWLACTAAARAEATQQWRDGRSRLVLLISLVLSLVAAVSGFVDARDLHRQRAEAQAVEQQRWLGQGTKWAHSAAHYGIYAFKPITPLAVLDPGIESFVGSTVWLEAHKQNDFLYRPAQDQPELLRGGLLTPASVLLWVAPLAIVFLGFGAFAADRESGTLRLWRLGGARPSAVAAGRGAVLLAVGLGLWLPAAASAVAATAVFANGGGLQDGALRFFLLSAAAVTYLATWVLATLAASALCTRPRTALGLLIGAWVLVTLILPRAAVELARVAAPLPTAQAFRAALDAELGDPHQLADEAKAKQALLDQYGVKDVKDLPVNWSGISLQRSEDRGNAIFDRHFGALFEAQARQSRWIDGLSLFSTPLAMVNLSSHLAATDLPHHVHYLQAAEAQRRLIQRVLNDDLTRHPDVDGKRHEADAALWARIPAFVNRVAPLGTIEWPKAGAASLLLAAAAVLLTLTLALRRL
jgi:ABC-2 type transport system permease protein